MKIRDFWFEDDRNKKEEKGADFAEYHDMLQLPKNMAGFIGKAERMTLISDLTVEKDIIQAAFRKNTRYEIRRAQKEGCKANFLGVDEIKQQDILIHKINQEHTKLFKKKGVRVKDEYDFMHAAAQKGMLIVSTAEVEDLGVCVYHVYVVGNQIARLLHSISVFRDTESNYERNAVGRANRYLHFEDMLYLKEIGYTTYDWGGYSDDEEVKSISDFKLSFGGEKRTVYTVFYATSLAGRLISGVVKRIKLKGFVDED